MRKTSATGLLPFPERLLLVLITAGGLIGSGASVCLRLLCRSLLLAFSESLLLVLVALRSPLGLRPSLRFRLRVQAATDDRLLFCGRLCADLGGLFHREPAVCEFNSFVGDGVQLFGAETRAGGKAVGDDADDVPDEGVLLYLIPFQRLPARVEAEDLISRVVEQVFQTFFHALRVQERLPHLLNGRACVVKELSDPLAEYALAVDALHAADEFRAEESAEAVLDAPDRDGVVVVGSLAPGLIQSALSGRSCVHSCRAGSRDDDVFDDVRAHVRQCLCTGGREHLRVGESPCRHAPLFVSLALQVLCRAEEGEPRPSDCRLARVDILSRRVLAGAENLSQFRFRLLGPLSGAELARALQQGAHGSRVSGQTVHAPALGHARATLFCGVVLSAVPQPLIVGGERRPGVLPPLPQSFQLRFRHRVVRVAGDRHVLVVQPAEVFQMLVPQRVRLQLRLAGLGAPLCLGLCGSSLRSRLGPRLCAGAPRCGLPSGCSGLCAIAAASFLPLPGPVAFLRRASCGCGFCLLPEG